MSRVNAVVYDAEIKRCILGRNEVKDPEFEYAGGWSDYAGMGIACVCAIDLLTGDPHVYLEDNLADFQSLILSRDLVIGFNSIMFDDKLLAAHDVVVATGYDLKVETGGVVQNKRVPGRSLDDFARVNLGTGKPMSGALAPKFWQLGQRGKVIDYCMNDVVVTAKLALAAPTLIDPVNMTPLAGMRALQSISPQLEMNAAFGLAEMVH